MLNLGVKPDIMIPLVAERFVAAGGTLLDETAATGFSVHPDGIEAQLADGAQPRTARLLIDCMGHASPIVRQLRCVHIDRSAWHRPRCALANIMLQKTVDECIFLSSIYINNEEVTTLTMKPLLLNNIE